MLTFFIEAPAVAAPGLDGWTNTARILKGEKPYAGEALQRKAPEILPPTERRRSSSTTKLALRVAHESMQSGEPDKEGIATVFSSANGDTEILHQLCESLAEPDPMVSPMRFHNSVHNAPAGYWSIASGSMKASTSIACFDGSFAAGLLSSAVQVNAEQQPIMLVAYDIPFPAPLDACRPITDDFASAIRLTPERTETSLAQCTLSTREAGLPYTTMSLSELETLRRGNPAAQALPLLSALASRGEREIVLEYLDELDLMLKIKPC